VSHRESGGTKRIAAFDTATRIFVNITLNQQASKLALLNEPLRGKLGPVTN